MAKFHNPHKKIKITFLIRTLILFGPFSSACFSSNNTIHENQFNTSAEQHKKAQGIIVFHSYTAYDTIPQTTIRPLDGELWIYDLSSKNSRPLHEVNTYVRHTLNARFSSDGKKIAFAGLPKNIEVSPSWRQSLDVYIYDFETKQVKNISQFVGFLESPEEDPDFSPTSDILIFKRNLTELWSVNLNTMEARILLDKPENREKSMPVFSPSGNEVAFALDASEQSSLYILDLHSQEQKLITNKKLQNYFPIYLNRNKIAYVRWSSLTNRNDQIFYYDINKQHSSQFQCNDELSNNSDPFVISDFLVGFSSTRESDYYALYFCKIDRGQTQKIPLHVPNKHALGGTFSAAAFF